MIACTGDHALPERVLWADSRVTIPAEFRRRLELRPGDVGRLDVDEMGAITITFHRGDRGEGVGDRAERVSNGGERSE